MKAPLVILLAGAIAAPVAAQHPGHPPAPKSQPPTPEPPPPQEAYSGPRHAADMLFDPGEMTRARAHLRAEQGAFKTYWIMVDRLDARFREGRDGYLWDAQAWYGGDIHKLWLKTEGEGTFDESTEQAEIQAVWSRAVTPWFDFQLGARHDFRPEPERTHLVLGLQGLVPYEYEIDAAAFLSEEGDLTARLEAEYDLQITQRLILQPRLELDFSAQDIPEIGTGSGVSSGELGARLRYEFAREFAPYVGIEYERRFGGTADYARAAGEDTGGWNVLAGLRAWF